MNILYINHYAGSKNMGMEFRPYYMGKIWLEMGHNVTIVGSSFSHLRVSQPNIDGSLSTEKVDGLNYVWIKGIKYVGNGFGRILNMMQFLFGLFFFQKNIVAQSQPDVVIASSTYPMDIWPAKYIAQICDARLVFELHDVWPQSLTEIAGLSRFNPLVILSGIAERAVYSSADRVISMLPAINDHCAGLGFDTSNLTIVPNGIVFDDWSKNEVLLPDEIISAITDMRFRDHMIVCYAGAHGIPNDLENLINAADLLRNDKVSFLLVGDGNLKTELAKLINLKNIDNISMCKTVSKSMIPQLLELVDVGFIGAKNRSIYNHGISPNKMADYMMAEIPIICAIKAGNDPVTEASCGYTVTPSNPKALSCVILEMQSIGHTERKLMGRRGKEYALQNYGYATLAKKFMDALK
ncbi:glycosyltransferase family 4 protein [Paracoccaceae bacterium]|nr:glycosyltransferase family 4 protein [Paracoccaceae bacterium]